MTVTDKKLNQKNLKKNKFELKVIEKILKLNIKLIFAENKVRCSL